MFGIDRKTARNAWTCAVVLLALIVALAVHKTIVMFAIALMLAYLLFPIVDALEVRLPWRSRTLAVAVPFAVGIGLIGTFGAVVAPHVERQAMQLHANVTRPDFKERLSAWTVAGVPFGKVVVGSVDRGQMGAAWPQISRGVRSAMSDLTNLVLIPILAFFMLKDGRWIRDAIVSSLDGRGRVRDLLRDAHVLLLQYMRALLVMCMTTLLVYTVGLRLLDVPYSFLLALIAFPLEFLPLLGPLASAVVIVGVCEFAGAAYGFHGEPHASILAVIVFLVAYRLVADYVLSPYLMRRGMKMHPLLVLFGVFAGGDIGGIAGAFLSVPILALLRLAFYESKKKVRGGVALVAS